MRLQASKLDPMPFLRPKTAAAAAISSILFEPSSRSLALMLSDFSILLYSHLPLPFPSSAPSRAPTVVSPISSAACFLRLLPSARVLFLSTSPLAAGGSIQLRAWTLSSNNASAFAPARLNFKKQLGRSAVSLDLRHGFSVRIAGSVNVFVVHSLAESQIWIIAAKPVAEEDMAVELMKCAVVELTLPIYSFTLTVGFLLLAELNGVRVFPLRPLIKGSKVKKGTFAKKRVSPAIDLCRKNLPNGITIPKVSKEKTSGPESACSCSTVGGSSDLGAVGGKADHCCTACKRWTLRINQVFSNHFSFFVGISEDESQISESSMGPLKSPKAVSIHLLSQMRFLVLDSAGDIHVISLHDTSVSSEDTAQSSIKFSVHKHPLDHTMEVQMLAVLPDNSAPIEAAFMSEKIQNIISISANSVLVLCEGSIFLYAVG